MLPKESLEILQTNATKQLRTCVSFILAIPSDELRAYHSLYIINFDVSAVNDGLLMTMPIQLASRQTLSGMCEAKIIPVPQLETEYALRWTSEIDYFILFE